MFLLINRWYQTWLNLVSFIIAKFKREYPKIIWKCEEKCSYGGSFNNHGETCFWFYDKPF